MALSISQMTTVSYPEVLNEMRKAENQWVENAFLRECERMGVFESINGAPLNEVALDYKRNDGAEFQTTDLAQVSTVKTDVLTAGQFVNAQLQVPIVWSKKDEMENSAPNQKVALVKQLLENAINSHDDVIEQAIFVTDTNGFLGLPTIATAAGTGSLHGIDSTLETWWRNGAGTYLTAGTDLLAKMTTLFNALSKGSGSSLAPKMIVSDAGSQALYEATQTSLIRYNDTREADAGFKILAFKTARYSFSQYGTTSIYMLNPKSFRITKVKGAFRLLGDTVEFVDQAGYIRKIYTLAQTKVNNRSRIGVLARV